MQNNLSIGTYSISSDGSSMTYTVPSMLTKEMAQHLSVKDYSEEAEVQDMSEFDKTLKGILSVPPPPKDKK
jgi:hypothetical protein